MPLPAPPSVLLHFGFVALYIVLDAASFIHPLHGLNITPWNPALALGLVFLLRRGRAGRLPLMLTVVLSEWAVRGIPQTWWATLLSALTLAGGYLLLGERLRRYLPPASLFDERRHLLGWIATCAFGTLLISLLYVSTLCLLGLLPGDGWSGGVLQFWVGDAVGIAVAMPLFWWLSSRRGRTLLKAAASHWETPAYALLSLVMLWLAFNLGDGSRFKLFYLLFLPIIWASARQGMAGAILSASLLQVEVIAAVQLLGLSAVTVAELQTLALAMALIGFFIGSVVDQQRRTSEELKQSLRLAAAGEMAGALAHELNQPLTALAAYAAACETLLARGEAGARLQAAIQGMLRESGRAGEVLGRLRDFFRTGATRLETVELAALVAQAIGSCRDKAAALGVDLQVGPLPPARLLADQLQLEVVLRNLLTNAFDAVAGAAPGQRRVALRAELLPGTRLGIVVEDSGPGLSAEQASQLFTPFRSAKSSGLGLGLAISRAIVDTHGGSLSCEPADRGIFRIILPLQETPP